MSDTLRDRIAEAILGAGCPCTDCTAAALEKADAVIRELGLKHEDGECGYCHAQLPGCRYVTEWQPDTPNE